MAGVNVERVCLCAKVGLCVFVLRWVSVLRWMKFPVPTFDITQCPMLLGSKLVLISLQLYLERELVLAFPLFEPSLLQKTAARFYNLLHKHRPSAKESVRWGIWLEWHICIKITQES